MPTAPTEAEARAKALQSNTVNKMTFGRDDDQRWKLLDR
jgi:hypothetical protein